MGHGDVVQPKNWLSGPQTKLRKIALENEHETGAQGLEPQLTEPESVVLPITPRPIGSVRFIILDRFTVARSKRFTSCRMGPLETVVEALEWTRLVDLAA